MYLIIFDCDGTLADSQDTIVRGLAAGYAAVGLQMPDRRTALSIVGLSLETAFLRLVGEQNAALVPQMSEAYRATNRAHREKGDEYDPLFPGAHDVLDILSGREDVLLGIATGKARRGVDYLLQVHGLEGRFVTIQTADTSPSKPHPDMVLQALAETGVEARHAVIVGDTSYDMEMGQAAGVRCLGVTWGYHERAALIEAGAEVVIDDFDQLIAGIDTLFETREETV
ncbi:MAG: HAD-IA family hydrolase [Rhodobacteraceae bacterium]|nr:HAD-IA family hydrolase [Paracoccaceae bacterium]